MRKMLICTAIWTVALLGAERAPDQELQRAIDLMETKGDLPSATRLFEEVARGRDRAVAARALLYLGQCHERQGAEKARATYQRIERDFGEQREMVAEARRRVVALGGERSAAGSLSARQVWSGANVDSEASITPDGKTMAFIDWSTGDIA
ncbi:MAG: hypothetical protein JNN08_01485, partial [Bryobacterales bacterium]|nr:hypothetical protein [Bryobacterales bacterium]